ncbi:MAG TPA: DUF1579 domain-containing protein [Planctomycetota bacterium]|jgi:hypothetical protein|nr:DUF1579 domain-containing protein [Planctomycetota bacterium]
MSCKSPVLVTAVLGASALVFGAGYAASALQDYGKKAPQGDEVKMEMPKPGPEHMRLAKSVGTWDADVESMMESPPSKSKGTETVKALPGGLWVISDFQGDFGGMPFYGHGITGYDTMKGKHVGAWIDNFGTHLAMMEGTFDEKTKTGTFFMEGPDMMGKMVKHRMVEKWVDDDNRTFEMFMPGPDGKEGMGMRITYKRRK